MHSHLNTNTISNCINSNSSCQSKNLFFSPVFRITIPTIPPIICTPEAPFKALPRNWRETREQRGVTGNLTAIFRVVVRFPRSNICQHPTTFLAAVGPRSRRQPRVHPYARVHRLYAVELLVAAHSYGIPDIVARGQSRTTGSLEYLSKRTRRSPTRSPTSERRSAIAVASRKDCRHNDGSRPVPRPPRYNFHLIFNWTGIRDPLLRFFLSRPYSLASVMHARRISNFVPRKECRRESAASL